MSTHKCLRCNGSKRYAPLGGMYHECQYCKGVGHVLAEPITKADIAKTHAIGIDLPIIKKKPGRKPGWNKSSTMRCQPETATITE